MKIDREKAVLQIQSGSEVWYINFSYVITAKIDVIDDNNANVTFHMVNNEKISLTMEGHQIDMLRTYYKEIADII